jgi:lactoylglutathione lyase
MYFIHTTIYTPDLEQSKRYWDLLDMRVVRELELPKTGNKVAFFAADRDEESARSERFSPTIALIERKDEGPSGFSHICYRVDDIYATCQMLIDKGHTLKMPPRDGFRAMVRGPEGAVIEFHQKGERKPIQEPWASMPDGD